MGMYKRETQRDPGSDLAPKRNLPADHSYLYNQILPPQEPPHLDSLKFRSKRASPLRDAEPSPLSPGRLLKGPLGPLSWSSDHSYIPTSIPHRHPIFLQKVHTIYCGEISLGTFSVSVQTYIKVC